MQAILKGKKFKPVIIPLYDWWVFAVLGKKQLDLLCKEWKIEYEVDKECYGAKALCIPFTFTDVYPELDGKEFNILYFDPEHFSLSTTVHECVHSIHFMMKSRGIPIKYSNTEVMAYGTEYLFDRVIKELGQAKK